MQDQRQGFAQRKALKALRSAWSSIEQLDERSGKPSDALWAKLVALHPPPEEGAPAGAAAAVRAAEDEVHEQHAPAGASAGTDEVAGDTGGQAGQLTLAEQVDVALKYLRSEYNYCVFCGCQYADEADMLGNCPGMNEDDH